MKIVPALLLLGLMAPFAARAQTGNTQLKFNDTSGNTLAEVLGAQSSSIPRGWPCIQGNPSATVHIYACGAATTLLLSGEASSGGTVQIGLSGDLLGVGTSTPGGVLDVEGGTANAATDGLDIVLNAQTAGAGNQNGGNITLIPGAATGTGTPGLVQVTGVMHVDGGAAAAATNALNTYITAQGGGAGNQNGGSILLTPGAATGAGAAGVVQVVGSLNIGGTIFSGGSHLWNNTGSITAGSGSANWATLAGGASGLSPTLTVAGSDTNVGYNIVLKGTGALAVNSVSGVSCTAGTVSLTTLVVTRGIVTHC